MLEFRKSRNRKFVSFKYHTHTAMYQTQCVRQKYGSVSENIEGASKKKIEGTPEESIQSEHPTQKSCGIQSLHLQLMQVLASFDKTISFKSDGRGNKVRTREKKNRRA